MKAIGADVARIAGLAQKHGDEVAADRLRYLGDLEGEARTREYWRIQAEGILRPARRLDGWRPPSDPKYLALRRAEWSRPIHDELRQIEACISVLGVGMTSEDAEYVRALIARLRVLLTFLRGQPEAAEVPFRLVRGFDHPRPGVVESWRAPAEEHEATARLRGWANAVDWLDKHAEALGRLDRQARALA